MLTPPLDTLFVFLAIAWEKHFGTATTALQLLFQVCVDVWCAAHVVLFR